MEQLFKRCCTCKLEKETSQFYRNKLFLDGHSLRCKTCSVIKPEKHNPRILCSCGKMVLKYSINKHIETSIHNKLIKSENN
jgi:hypothetical protein